MLTMRSQGSLLTAVQSGYWERVGERAGEAADHDESPAPIRGGSEDHGRPVVSLYKLDDPWTALLTPEQRAAAAADVPF